MPYPIWASDAVLLGRALEEYLDANCDSTVYFLDFLWSRLSPFYPPIKFRERRDTVDIEDAPRDITWETAAEHQAQVGFSPSLPNSWFLRPTGAIRGCHVTLDKPVRHLMEEVAELVAKCCARSPSDDAQFNLAVEAPMGPSAAAGLGIYI
ncbi:MAG: hypothetical protein ACREHD_05765 [Pirellulales bacterium]